MVVTHAVDRPAVRDEVRPGGVRPRDDRRSSSAYPGDIIGLVNAQALRVGDTIYVGDRIEYPPVPTFAPEHFMTATAARHRPLQAVPPRHRAARPGGRRPGAALRPARRPEPGARGGRADAVRGRRGADDQRVQLPDPALAGSTTRWPAVPTPTARGALAGIRGVEVLQRTDGTYLALFVDKWRANNAARDNPDVLLEELPGRRQLKAAPTPCVSGSVLVADGSALSTMPS